MPIFPSDPLSTPGGVTGGPKPPQAPGIGEPPNLLEADLRPHYDAWKARSTPQANGLMVKKLEPIIQSAVKTFGGAAPSPNLVSKARLMAIQALPAYDPSKSKMKTYLMNHLQGLHRVAARDNQIMSVPEQVQLDHFHLHQSETELRDHLGRDPSTSELADHTNLSMRRIEYVRKLRPAMSEGSINQPMAGAESDDYNEPAVKNRGGDDAKAWHRFVYDSLEPTDQLIMEHTLGLRQKRILSNQEIARVIGVSPSAVSQRKARIQKHLDERNKHGLL